MEPVILNEWMYERGRGPELRSCRITVYDLFPYLEHDFADETLLGLWPVTQVELDALKRYIADNRAEIAAKSAAMDERIRRATEEQGRKFAHIFRGSRERLEILREVIREDRTLNFGVLPTSAEARKRRWVEFLTRVDARQNGRHTRGAA